MITRTSGLENLTRRMQTDVYQTLKDLFEFTMTQTNNTVLPTELFKLLDEEGMKSYKSMFIWANLNMADKVGGYWVDLKTALDSSEEMGSNKGAIQLIIDIAYDLYRSELSSSKFFDFNKEFDYEELDEACSTYIRNHSLQKGISEGVTWIIKFCLVFVRTLMLCGYVSLDKTDGNSIDVYSYEDLLSDTSRPFFMVLDGRSFYIPYAPDAPTFAKIMENAKKRFVGAEIFEAGEIVEVNDILKYVCLGRGSVCDGVDYEYGDVLIPYLGNKENQLIFQLMDYKNSPGVIFEGFNPIIASIENSKSTGEFISAETLEAVRCIGVPRVLLEKNKGFKSNGFLKGVGFIRGEY